MKQTSALRRAFVPALAVMFLVLMVFGVNQVEAASPIVVTLSQSGGTSATYSRDPSFSLEKDSSWITISTSSPSAFTIKASSNSTGKGRIGYVYVKRQGSVVTTYKVVQPGSTNLSVGIAKGSSSTYSKNSNQSVSASGSWITIYSPNNYNFRIDYSANTTGSTRIGYVYVKEGSTKFTTYKITQSSTVTVTYNMNGGSGSNFSRSIAYGKPYGKVDSPTRTGYNFAGWYTAVSGGSQVTETTIMQKTVNHTLYAHWTPKKFTVTFMDGTTKVSTKTVTYDSTYGTLPTRTKTGYNAADWYTATSNGTKITSSTKVKITADQTLYARWNSPKTFTVTFMDGTTKVSTKTVTYDSTYGTLPTRTKSGYYDATWYTATSNGTKITSSSKVKITANQTLYARWLPKTYTVTFDPTGGSCSTESKTVTFDSTYGTLPKPVRADYIFAGWYTKASGGSEVTATTKVTTASNHTLYAHWTKGKKVLVINFDPDITLSDGSKVKQHTLRSNWSDPHTLISEFVSTMKEVSYGNVNYSVEKTNIIDVNAFPKGDSGKAYTAKDYYDTLTKAIKATDGAYWNYSGWKSFGRFDYEKYLADYDVINKINKGEIDEVWFFTGPMVGVNLSESIMVGKDAFYMNGSPIVKAGVRNFAVYGFSYERGLGEMLEDAGHRMEWTMSRVYSGVTRSNWVNQGFDITEKNYIKYVNGKKTYKQYSELNDWEKFWAHDLVTDGKIVAGVGSVHCGPNARGQYDWNNDGKGTWERATPKSVKSYCDDWLNYPNLTGSSIMVNSSAWGGTLEGHHKWWFKRIPHANGSSNGKYNNWWKYFLFEDLK